MKKMMIYNFWILIIGWTLFLNNLGLIGAILLFISSLILYIKKKKINYWRVLALNLIVYYLYSYLLTHTTISLFFKNSLIFVIAISVNISIMSEYLCDIDNLFKNEVLLISILVYLFTSILIILVPKESYTIFTKRNLFLTNVSMFMPIIMVTVLSYKKLVND